MRWLGSLVFVASLLVPAVLPSVAHAQNDAAKASALSREAEDLMAASKYAEACPKYKASLALDYRGSTALDLAVCLEKQGKIGQAYRAYGVAADLAGKEKRSDRERQAKSARTKLFFKLPKLTVKPPPKKPNGFIITVNDEEMPSSKYGKGWEADTGEVVIKAMAPGHKPWETKIKLREREQKTVTVPALQVGEPTAPVPVSPTPTPGGKPVPAAPAPVPVEPDEPSTPRDDDEGGRLVIEVGPMGGLLIHTIDRSPVDELNATDYQYRSSSNGETIATCGDTNSIPGAGECDGLFETEIGGTVGGELFVAWAIIPRFHLGARFFGAARFSEGWMVAGGPAFSVRAAGPLWLGASFLVGGSEHNANIIGAEGSVPPEHQALNDGQTLVPVPLFTGAGADRRRVVPEEAIMPSGVLVGGGLELSLALVGPSPNAAVTTDLPIDFLAGSLMLGVWPSLLVAEEGFAISIPGGLAYRFH